MPPTFPASSSKRSQIQHHLIIGIIIIIIIKEVTPPLELLSKSLEDGGLIGHSQESLETLISFTVNNLLLSPIRNCFTLLLW
jgi:hypothetical protein